MKGVYAWVAYVTFAASLVGAVAWPLWSDNDGWAFAFVGFGSLAILPVVFGAQLQAIWSALRSPSDTR